MSESKLFLGFFDRENAEFYKEALEKTIQNNPKCPALYAEILKQLTAELGQ